MICYAPIAYQLFSFAVEVERILKEIADNFAELINESTHFCSPFFCRLAVLNLAAYAFEFFNKRCNFFENALLLGFVLRIKRTHFRQC